MSLTTNYPFNSISNYAVSDSGEIGISGGKAVLLLQSGAVAFVEDFNSDTGSTYDNIKAEFVAGSVRQKDQRPANSIVAANFNSSLNANWGADGFASLVAGINGSPSLSANKLLCDYAVNSGQNGIYYEDSLIGSLSGNWVAKFKYTPNYTTTPPENINIFSLSPASGTTDDLEIFNSPSGNNIRISANGLAAVTYATWTPTAGQEYVFEIICISNQVSIYIDGVQLGTAKTITPGQGTGAVRAWLGAYAGGYNVASGSFDDFILYSTAPQDAGYTFPSTIYAATNVILPEMEHIGDGSILSFSSLVTVEANNPRYTLQIGQSGNYLYWDGAAWSISNNTYAQANDLATFNANAASLPVAGEKFGQFQILFTDQNPQGSVSTLTANMVVNIGYPTDNPWIEPLQSISAIEALEGFAETVIKVGLDGAKYALYKNSQLYYHDGLDWVVSDGTYAQSNTVAEITTNQTSFTTTKIDFNFRAFLHSDDGSTYPQLDSIDVTYDFAQIVTPLVMCLIYGYSLNPDNTPNTDAIVVQLNIGANETLGNNQLSTKSIYITPRSDGYFEKELANNTDMETGSYYKWTYQGRSTNRVVAKQSKQEYNDMTVLT